MTSAFNRKSKTYFDDPPVPPPVPPVSPPPPPPLPPPGRVFTQAEVDKMMADHRQTLQKTNAELTTRLEQLQNTANLTKAEKEELAQTLETLNNQHKTAAQQQAEAADKAKKKYEADLAATSQDRDKYKTGYHTLIVTNSITAGAVKNNAADKTGKQLQLMLLPQAKVVDELDGEGKPTGHLVAKIGITYLDDKTKKPVSVELPVEEAIAKMATMDEYANLFMVDGKPGVGGSSGAGAKTGTNGTPDFSKMSALEYREWREKQKKK
jgi:hypothetical protein